MTTFNEWLVKEINGRKVDADYNTNAPSYYDELARKQALFKILAEKIFYYDQELAKRFAEWDQNIAEMPDELKRMLAEWMEDGTLDHIINDTIFSWKADKVDLDALAGNVATVKTKLSDFPKLEGETDDGFRMQRAVDHAKQFGNPLLVDENISIKRTITIPSDITIKGTNNPVIQLDIVNDTGLIVSGKNVNISGIILNGLNKSRLPLYIIDSKNVSINGVEVFNAYSDTRNCFGIEIANSENVFIDSCHIHQIVSLENGVVGDAVGSARGVYLRNVVNGIVRYCTFEAIGGFEDGDAIHVQSTLATNHTLIEYNNFPNITKRAVKLQGDNNIVRDNVIRSTYTDRHDCPLTAISDYGKNNHIIDNDIHFLRASSGIRIANESTNAVVKGNRITLDEAGLYRTELTHNSQACGIWVVNSFNTKIIENDITTKSRKIYSTEPCVGVEIKDNVFSPGVNIYVDIQSYQDLIMTGNIFKGDMTTPVFQFTELEDVNGCYIANNIFYPATNYLRFLKTISNVVVLPNVFLDPAATNRVRTSEVTSGADNIQYIGDFKQGTVTVLAGQTDVSTPHGLGRMPKNMVFTPIQPIDGGYSLRASTTSTMVIRLEKAQVTDTTFYWRAE